MRDAELGFARELLAATREGRAPSPEAQAYQDDKDAMKAARPFHEIEACVHGLIDSLAAGQISPEDARAHFDGIMDLRTESYLAQQRREKIERRTAR